MRRASFCANIDYSKEGQMNLIPDEMKLIKELKRTLEELIGLDKIRLILFGSKATGGYDRYSDTDIAIIVKGLTIKQKNRILEEIAAFEIENIMPLSTLILSEKDLEFLKTRERAIAFHIENEGIPL